MCGVPVSAGRSDVVADGVRTTRGVPRSTERRRVGSIGVLPNGLAASVSCVGKDDPVGVWRRGVPVSAVRVVAEGVRTVGRTVSTVRVRVGNSGACTVGRSYVGSERLLGRLVITGVWSRTVLGARFSVMRAVGVLGTDGIVLTVSVGRVAVSRSTRKEDVGLVETAGGV